MVRRGSTTRSDGGDFFPSAFQRSIRCDKEATQGGRSIGGHVVNGLQHPARIACGVGSRSALADVALLNVSASAGEVPKEGTFATTTYFHDVSDVVEATPDRYMWTFEDY